MTSFHMNRFKLNLSILKTACPRTIYCEIDQICTGIKLIKIKSQVKIKVHGNKQVYVCEYVETKADLLEWCTL